MCDTPIGIPHDNPVLEVFHAEWHNLISRFPSWNSIHLTASEGYSDHFRSERGIAVTRSEDRANWEIVFSAKARGLPEAKLRAIVRHEIGHVLDFTLDSEALNQWALAFGLSLPATPERRADALATFLWGDVIYYDRADLIQTLESGISPRPEHLGL